MTSWNFLNTNTCIYADNLLRSFCVTGHFFVEVSGYIATF